MQLVHARGRGQPPLNPQHGRHDERQLGAAAAPAAPAAGGLGLDGPPGLHLALASLPTLASLGRRRRRGSGKARERVWRIDWKHAMPQERAAGRGRRCRRRGRRRGRHRTHPRETHGGSAHDDAPYRAFDTHVRRSLRLGHRRPLGLTHRHIGCARRALYYRRRERGVAHEGGGRTDSQYVVTPEFPQLVRPLLVAVECRQRRQRHAGAEHLNTQRRTRHEIRVRTAARGQRAAARGGRGGRGGRGRGSAVAVGWNMAV